MSEKPLDKRSKMTRLILKQSLIELMKTKPIHEISIKKICENADINRSTFYHHYGSPYELYEDIINDITSKIIAIAGKHRHAENRLTKTLSDSLIYIENNRELFLVILGENGNLGVGERLYRNFEKFVDKQNSSDFSSYCSQFITAGMISIVWRWLNTENRRPAKDLSVVISALIMHGVGRAITIKETELKGQK